MHHHTYQQFLHSNQNDRRRCRSFWGWRTGIADGRRRSFWEQRIGIADVDPDAGAGASIGASTGASVGASVGAGSAEHFCSWKRSELHNFRGFL